MSPPDAVPEQLLPVLDRLAQTLNERQVSYALIGGLGVALRGPIRATRDIDLLVKIPQLELAGVFEALIRAGFQLDVAQAIGVWNRDHLLDFMCGSVRVDWLKPVLRRPLSTSWAERVGSRSASAASASRMRKAFSS